MHIDIIRQALERRPFRPFIIRMAGGSEFEVSHPHALAWSSARESPSALVCVMPDGRWAFLAPEHVIELAVPAGEGRPPRESNAND